MHEVLVNRLGGLSLPRKSVVRLTEGGGKQQQAPHGMVMRMLNYILLIASLNIAHIDRSDRPDMILDVLPWT